MIMARRMRRRRAERQRFNALEKMRDLKIMGADEKDSLAGDSASIFGDRRRGHTHRHFGG
jgi:hypothetical protein